MEDNTKKIKDNTEKVLEKNTITRKEALLKTGKYAAFTALGMMVLLSPKQSQAGSQTTPPGYGPGF